MELKQYLAVLWRWWWLIALAVLIAGGFSFVVSRQSPPVYQTKSEVVN